MHIAQVKMACRDAVKEKGLDRITVEDLVQVKNFLLKILTILIFRRLPRKAVNLFQTM